MNTGKEQMTLLAGILAARGVEHVVVSPGSRNAPAVILFNRQEGLTLHSIPDERSAAFYALGMAMKTGKTVATLCTSGSAAINYGPAVVEAYYQKIPLLIITADRPGEWIDQGDSQTIRQNNLFAGHVRKSFNLPADPSTKDLLRASSRMINEAIDRTHFPAPGPVHLNLPVAEPLYNIPDQPVLSSFPSMILSASPLTPDAELVDELAGSWNKAASKLILIGQLLPGNGLDEVLPGLAGDPSVIILTETTSNVRGAGYITTIDRVIEGIPAGKEEDFKPDILLTLGGAVVSKKIKALLRKLQPAEHWHVSDDPDEFYMDTYQSLTRSIYASTLPFAGKLAEKVIPIASSYRERWVSLDHEQRRKHKAYLESLPYSDLKVFEALFSGISEQQDIHLANSTPVRYAQLFDHEKPYRFLSNRGTSGIDGCLSTAAGYAMVSERPVTIITGDIGFFYDSNGLWNRKHDSRFRVILINNGGGNIFRFLQGPSDYPELEAYLETQHDMNASGLAATFGFDYYHAATTAELDPLLASFYSYDKGKPAVLEISTPALESARVLKDYFKYLKA